MIFHDCVRKGEIVFTLACLECKQTLRHCETCFDARSREFGVGKIFCGFCCRSVGYELIERLERSTGFFKAESAWNKQILSHRQSNQGTRFGGNNGMRFGEQPQSFGQPATNSWNFGANFGGGVNSSKQRFQGSKSKWNSKARSPLNQTNQSGSNFPSAPQTLFPSNSPNNWTLNFQDGSWPNPQSNQGDFQPNPPSNQWSSWPNQLTFPSNQSNQLTFQPNPQTNQLTFPSNQSNQLTFPSNPQSNQLTFQSNPPSNQSNAQFQGDNGFHVANFGTGNNFQGEQSSFQPNQGFQGQEDHFQPEQTVLNLGEPFRQENVNSEPTLQNQGEVIEQVTIEDLACDQPNATSGDHRENLIRPKVIT